MVSPILVRKMKIGSLCNGLIISKITYFTGSSTIFSYEKYFIRIRIENGKSRIMNDYGRFFILHGMEKKGNWHLVVNIARHETQA